MERSNEVIYTGYWSRGVAKIRRQDPDGKRTTLRLAPSLAVRNHSPTGFSWGYSGSGPAQTSLALLLDWTGNPALANHYHQAFKSLVIGRLEQMKGWTLTGRQISDAITHIHSERMKRA